MFKFFGVLFIAFIVIALIVGAGSLFTIAMQVLG